MGFLAPKQPKLPPAPKPPSRDLALEEAQMAERNKRRKGRAANVFAGASEQSGAAKTLLGA